MTNEAIEALVSKMQNGETENFSELYEHFFERIYKFVYVKTHHKETAEDLTSQTFFKAFEKIQSFNGKKGSFSSWIYAIANNLIIDHFRTLKSTKDIDDAWDISSSDDVERDADMQLRMEELEKYMQTLSVEQRDILLMRLWEDLSFKEIAEILGKSEAACKMNYKRTLEKLRSEMPAEAFLLLLISIFS